MKFVLAGYGTRGDVEPCIAVGRELLRRGHEVRMAVPPNLLGVVESADIEARLNYAAGLADVKTSMLQDREAHGVSQCIQF